MVEYTPYTLRSVVDLTGQGRRFGDLPRNAPSPKINRRNWAITLVGPDFHRSIRWS